MKIYIKLIIKKIIFNRSKKILPNMLGFTYFVYNGNKFLPIYINKKMIGHKLGEFSITLKLKKKKKNDI